MVGVAALWGGTTKSVDVENGFISANCNSIIATNNYRRTEPFRGIATAPERARLVIHTIFKTDFSAGASQ